jgi:hypothetical protein
MAGSKEDSLGPAPMGCFLPMKRRTRMSTIGNGLKRKEGF